MSVPPESVTPPPPPPYTPPPLPSQPPTATGGTDDKTLALITHLSGIIFSFIVPLVMWLIHKDRADKAWLTGQAKEALNFQITVLIGYVICWILMWVLIGFFLWWLLWLFNLIFCIIAAVSTSKGENYRYPIALRLIN